MALLVLHPQRTHRSPDRAAGSRPGRTRSRGAPALGAYYLVHSVASIADTEEHDGARHRAQRRARKRALAARCLGDGHGRRTVSSCLRNRAAYVLV